MAKILVLQEVEGVYKLMAENLEKEGFEPIFGNSHFNAYKHFNDISLVIADGKHNSIVRKYKADRGIPIIHYSTIMPEENLFDCHITKHPNHGFNGLVDKVKEYLKNEVSRS